MEKIANQAQRLFGADFALDSQGRLILVEHLFEVYDAVGLLDVTTTPDTVLGDTTRLDVGTKFSYDSGTGELTINLTGNLEVSFSVSMAMREPSTDRKFEATAYLEIDTGSGFQKVPGSEVFLGNAEN
jgi:hypothetical protein